jgi:hypothetical protein
MPKVYLEIDDPNASATGRIVCEQWVDLETGVHQELVNHLTSTFFSSCFGFWRWLARQDVLQALTDPDPDPDEEAPADDRDATDSDPEDS